MEKNGTWAIENFPKGKNTICSQWVYKVQFRGDGSNERYKPRLVEMGNTQVEHVDLTETFAPVAKMAMVRVFLQVSVSLDWEVYKNGRL